MKDKKSVKAIILISLLGIIIMSIVDGLINPGYVYKSIIKIFMFLMIPLGYSLFNKNLGLKSMFKIKNKKQVFSSILLGVLVYTIILASYFFLKKHMDLDFIRELLAENLKVNKGNFVFVALYISFINSLLEEFFFRGFIFLNLKGLIKKKYAYIISAVLFAIYHVAIMGGWFNPVIFLLAMTGLFLGGMIFNYINESNSNLYNSWIVHMMANFAINTVGFIMFGIL